MKFVLNMPTVGRPTCAAGVTADTQRHVVVRTALATLAVLAFLIGPPAHMAAAAEAPTRERVSSTVTNFSRVTPTIAASGLLKDGAVAELKSFGFVTIIDLRGPNEGTALEKPQVESAGLRYVNIPVTTETPSDAQIAAFAGVAEDPANYPLLVHCQSGARVRGDVGAVSGSQGRGGGHRVGRRARHRPQTTARNRRSRAHRRSVSGEIAGGRRAAQTDALAYNASRICEVSPSSSAAQSSSNPCRDSHRPTSGLPARHSSARSPANRRHCSMLR